jgi:VCBS repeat protein
MKRVAGLAVCLSLACASLAGAQTTPLVPAAASPFDVGGASGQVLLADINRDGHLDLLTRHPSARAIRMHLGDGQARFKRSEAAVSLNFTPADMKLGDVNGDKILDLVVTAGARDLVDVLLGSATAVFRRAGGSPFAASDYLYQYNKRSLHLVDVDKDGHLDIVTANRRGQYAFRVLLGNGKGRFAAGPVLTVEPASEGYALAFGDIDGDGHIDAVTALSSPERGRLDVHLSDGRGAFRKVLGSRVSLPPTYKIEALADVNSDRRPDLILSHRSARVSLLLNRGRGRFAPAARSPFALSARPFSVALSDLNRDNHVDLVGAAESTVTVLLADGLAFPRARQSSVPAGPGAYNIAVGDLNADKRPDVVASSFESNAVTVLLGR